MYFLPVEPLSDVDFSIKLDFVTKGDIYSEFTDLFDEDNIVMTPAMKAVKVDIRECHLKTDPFFQGRRTVPSIDHLVPESRIREELRSFEKKGFIKRVRSSDGVFLTPFFFIPKKDGKKIRTLNDYRLLNKYCDSSGASFVDTLRTIRTVPSSWRIFSKLDVSNAFFSVGLTAETCRLFEFNIFNETYVWRVVPQGFLWSPIWFVERMKDIFSGLDCVYYADDVLLGGNTQKQHDELLHRVLSRFSKFGLKLNRSKVQISVSKLDFLGFRLKAGTFDLKSYCIAKASQLPIFSRYKQLERVIGALNFCRSHVIGLSQLMDDLLKAKAWAQKHPSECNEGWWSSVNEDVRELWDQVIEKGIELRLKDNLHKFTLFLDWSGQHRGYHLIGANSVEEEWTVAVGSSKDPVPFQSSFLGELCTVKWALQATAMFRGEKPTKVIVDNKGVIDAVKRSISSLCNDKRAARVLAYLCENERWCTFEYLPGNTNQVADHLSRLQPPETMSKIKASFEKIADLEDDTRKIVENTHREGHIGVKALIAKLRRKGLRRAGMYRIAREVVRTCPVCQKWQRPHPREQLGYNEALRVSDVVGCDFLGPLAGRGRKYLAVAVDGLSRYMETLLVDGPTTEMAIRMMEEWMDRHGQIGILMADAGPAFKSKRFLKYCQSKGISLRTAAPFHQSSNGLVERAISTLLQRIKKMAVDRKTTWRQIHQESVRIYNDTPHSVTQFTPFELRYPKNEGGPLDELQIREARKKAIESARRARQLWNEKKRRDSWK